LLNYLVFFSEFSHMHFYYRFMTEAYCRIWKVTFPLLSLG
jgi:hypothetical protein